MITYETLKELAQALSKVTGYRYVTFCEGDKDDLFVNLSNSKMIQCKSALYHPSFWIYESEWQRLELRGLPNLDWSQCLFDCKEADNEEEG